ncbi:MAG: alpha-amylase [Candidatus Bathyarchaeia archaeon]
MVDLLLIFKVHQPYRLRESFFWERSMFKRKARGELFDFYFDNSKNKEIFDRAAKKCYFPANGILFDLIDRFKRERKKVRVSFSISGVFLEQCESFNADLLESFKQLSATGCVEFLDQPYYHSLAGLYPVRDEFMAQVRMHRELMKDLFHSEPVAFENTELLYNNAIAKVVDKMGYGAIFTEGIDRILKGRSPNYVYKAKGCDRLRILLRNFKLTDDVAFRFSVRSWSDWPLTADKYADWLASTQGECVTIFPDYETFGEHHWPETGIHDFLKNLPLEIFKHENLSMSTPSEVLSKHRPTGEIDVEELGGTVSWADINRDTSGWLGNTMQWAYYTTSKELEPLVRESNDSEFLKLWRHFLTSDHLYYMFSAGGSPGEVHTYFSPYKTPTDAFVTALGALLDFESKLREYVCAANEPFLFYEGPGEQNFTGIKAWSLMGVVQAIQRVDTAVLEFHDREGDFEKWATTSLRDEDLGRRLKQIRDSGMQGEELRAGLLTAAQSRLNELKKRFLREEQVFDVRKKQTTL